MQEGIIVDSLLCFVNIHTNMYKEQKAFRPFLKLLKPVIFYMCTYVSALEWADANEDLGSQHLLAS
jgi:hypothetical protein